MSSAAAEFYKRAFGAVEVFRHPADEKGRTMHMHLHINGGSLMLSDSYPEHGAPHEKPQGFPKKSARGKNTPPATEFARGSRVATGGVVWLTGNPGHPPGRRGDVR